MLNPLIIGFVVFLSMAVVATVSALVLGLLISNANSSFGALGG